MNNEYRSSLNTDMESSLKYVVWEKKARHSKAYKVGRRVVRKERGLTEAERSAPVIESGLT